ncbi:flagellar basal-body MS-ring/collar protein FliF [Ramlibacter sp. H39-3-26]|uniref:flagellar basal-body MS-ring/collar protein FliF n=1 Tax=Curvibacter soli TaxID=3031331 RepID=UPI0023DBEA6F|nr:flagellar basal-body MS-ring/collar protein FliF [Ramlibacter sp. H39-3-26]MDF1484220.1 flagellar basal-body MS-ring/collar protein FliF [Ramlibacter sp. H39-3-26]
MAALNSMLSHLRPAAMVPRLPPGLMKSMVPLLVLAVALTALALMYLWRDQSAYKPVFGAREKVAAADMMATLDAEGIPYRVHPDSGQVLVPESMLGKTRMLLAAKGVTARLPAGLELMDRNDPLGVSQFVQDVRFRRGLEGELAQSIMSLDAVDAARVHLAIARSSSFVTMDGEKSSASVVLGLKPGRSLEQEQIAAIINMVAGSVASMEPQRVSVVDQAGHLLSARVDLTDGFEAGQGGEAGRRYEEQTRQNIRDLLAPVLGEGNFKASVTADVNNDRVQETREQYGDTPRVTNEATREELARDQIALGVPGSLSNRPVNVSAPNPANAAANAANNPQAGNVAVPPEANTAQKNATTRQFSYDRTVTQIKRSRGRLNKMNVAVVLNNAAAPGGGAWTAAQIADVERLLQGGLGIDAQRGDSLVVSAMAFPAVPALVPWWQRRDNIVDAAAWLGYVLAALLAFLFIARPLVKLAQQRWTPIPGMASADRPPLPVPGVAAALPAGLGITAQGAGVAPLLENYELPPPGSPVDVMVEHLRVLSIKESERVAEVVKQWVQKNA